MKSIHRFSLMVVIVLCLTVLFYCKKDEITIYLPSLSRSVITDITTTSVTTQGEVISDGGALVTARGICWSQVNATPCTSDSKTTDGSGVGKFTSSISGLTPGTTYYIRSYAINSFGTAYCSKTEFKTLTEIEVLKPVLTTTFYSHLTDTSFYSGGNVINDGGSPVSARGICWSTNKSPTISDFKTSDGDGTGYFMSSVTGLSPGTTYYARAYATNSTGTNYGSEFELTTTMTLPTGEIIFNPNLTYGTLSDIEGNNYKTIAIGTQTWMAENLRTTKYKDGTAIPLVTDKILWDYIESPAYCWYTNNPGQCKTTYGALYNWFTVNTGKLCPAGWHVPDDAEWDILSTFLGGENIAGGKLKETGTTHWKTPNTGAGNESGFSALPGGIHSTGWPNAFGEIGGSCYFWSSSELEFVIPDTDPVSKCLIASGRGIHSGSSVLYKPELWFDTDKRWGQSVRCLKD